MKVFVLLSWVIGFVLIVGLYNVDANAIFKLKQINKTLTEEKAELEKVIEANKIVISEKNNIVETLNAKIKMMETEKPVKPVIVPKVEMVKPVVDVVKNTNNKKMLESKLKALNFQKERLQDNASKSVSEQNYYTDLKRDALNIDMEMKRLEANIKRNENTINNINRSISKTEKKDAFGKKDTNPFNRSAGVDKQNQKSLDAENSNNANKIIALKNENMTLNTKMDGLESKKKMLHSTYVNKYRHDMKSISSEIETINKELQDANN